MRLAFAADNRFETVGGSLPLGDGVYFTAGIADEEQSLFDLITQGEK